MENKKPGIGGQTGKTREIISTILICVEFMFFTLTFMVPKFYGMTENYEGLIVFAILALLTLVNVNPIAKIREKDIDFIVLAAIGIVAIINILIVNSGFGCFFIVINFAIIWYLSSVMSFSKNQMHLLACMYAVMILYWFVIVYRWMFADYSSFAMNTNTAATFTIFTMLCVFILFELFYRKYPILVGFLVTLAIVKCFQLSLYHRSRGAFIMFGVFILLRYIVPKKWWENKKFFNTMFIIATFGSLAFVAFYIWLGTTGVNFRMPFFYKDIFSGREAIWYEFWTLFKQKPLTGIGTNVTITSFFEFNVHNALYNILVIHGVLVFAGVIFLMYRRLSKARVGISKRPVAFTAMVAVFAVCIESFFDVDMIWANYSMNMLFLLLVMCNRVEADEE